MNKSAIVLSVAALVMTAGSALAAPVTAGDVVVYRVGDGSAALTSAGNAVFVDEYTPTGSLVQSIALPTDSFVASGTATSEGGLTVSPDGRSIAITGYNTSVGTASVASVASARSVAIIDALTGNVSSYTNLTDAYLANNIRSAVTTNGTDIWTAGTGSGSSPGVRYTTAGSSTSTELSTTVTNTRQVNVFDGQLYVSDSSGSVTHLGTVGSGLPTASGQTITSLPGYPTSGSSNSPYQFFLADLSGSVAGVDTLYVADDGSDAAAGITKYALVGGTWVSDGTVGSGASAYRGLTGIVNTDGSVSLFATGSGQSLVSILDATGYNGAFTASPTTIASAGANTAIRGVGIVTAVPAPASIALLGLGGLLATRRKR